MPDVQTPSSANPQPQPQQLQLPGMPQVSVSPQGRFAAAAQFASLLLQVSQHLFPDRKYFDLTPDQRRMLDNETSILLLQARWRIESKAFADYFASPGNDPAPAGTILGEHPPAPGAAAQGGGGYL